LFALSHCFLFFFFQAEDGIRDFHVTGVQTCALPILKLSWEVARHSWRLTKSSAMRRMLLTCTPRPLLSAVCPLSEPISTPRRLKPGVLTLATFCPVAVSATWVARTPL